MAVDNFHAVPALPAVFVGNEKRTLAAWFRADRRGLSQYLHFEALRFSPPLLGWKATHTGKMTSSAIFMLQLPWPSPELPEQYIPDDDTGLSGKNGDSKGR